MTTETIDQFHIRVRSLAKYCDFLDTDFEIKMKIVCIGTSTGLRKRALRDTEYSLKDMLVEGRKAEISTAQTSGTEEKFQELRVNAIRKPGKKCYYCGFDYPHTDRPCPAQNTTCTVCGKKGYITKVCRSTRNQEPQIQVKKKTPFPPRKKNYKPKTARAKGQARAIAVEREVSDSVTDSTDSDYVYAIQQQKATTNGAKKTTLSIHNKQVQFLVDTGATSRPCRL